MSKNDYNNLLENEEEKRSYKNRFRLNVYNFLRDINEA